MYLFTFYPVGFDPPVRRPPLLTYALVAFMGVVFLAVRHAPGLLPGWPYALVFYPGNGAPWSIVTAAFLHGDWLHYLGNMAYLLALGPLLEERLGRVRFLLVFVGLGAGGNLLHGVATLAGWFGGAGLGVLGSSGAIAGMLALAAVRCPFARVVVAYWVLAGPQGQSRAGRARLGLPVASAGWLLLQVAHALVAHETGDGVSYAAHLGGFLLGLAAAGTQGFAVAGRAESRLVRGRRYLEAGEGLAAAGAFREHLALAPESRPGWLQLARALCMAGREAEAGAVYADVFRKDLDRGRLDLATAVFDEARRGRAAADLHPDLLARGARCHDRQLDFAAALSAYQDLVNAHPDHPDRDHALVRIVTLLRGPLGEPAAAAAWAERARSILPPGAWRDALDRFVPGGRSPAGLRREPRARPPGSPAASPPEPAT
ncbi:MAG: rhomboid family intramembrane serine protease [Candidatus Krumholzibacteriia bacterium]